MHGTSSHNLERTSSSLTVLAASIDRSGVTAAPNSNRNRLAVSMVFCLALLSLSALSGCAAFRPLNGVPARFLPDELKGCSRENGQMIDLSYLRQQAPAGYMVDAGDVLAVYIEQVLGQREQPPINQPLDTTWPPTLGYPLTVRDDGTLSHCIGPCSIGFW